MPLKFRLIVYAVVGFLIPLLIWLVYGYVPMDAVWWIIYCVGLLTIVEGVNAWLKKRNR